MTKFAFRSLGFVFLLLSPAVRATPPEALTAKAANLQTGLSRHHPSMQPYKHSEEGGGYRPQMGEVQYDPA